MSNTVATGGNDTLIGSGADDYFDGLGGNDFIQGGGGNDVLIGNTGNDALKGDGGADYMEGDTGNDTYVINSPGDVAFENPNEGTDFIISFITLDMSTAGANIENLRLASRFIIDSAPSGGLVAIPDAAPSVTGNDLDNTLEGNGLQNVLSGGLGDDTYIVHDLPGATISFIDSGVLYSNIPIFDIIHENTGEGNDTIVFDPYVTTSTAYVLPDITVSEVENLTLGGTFNLNGTGNAGDNTLTGNAGTNILTGLDGNDTYVVQTATDKVVELNGTAGGSDTIRCDFTYTLAKLPNVENITLTGSASANATGNAAVNILAGNDGTNILDGVSSPGAIGDTYVGSLGNDTYMIHSANDVIIADTNTAHAADGGTDLIISSVSYDLTVNAPDADNLTLTGTLGLNGTGNALNNVITGNAGANVLDGGTGGSDTLLGGAGNDTLTVHGSANNTLDGGLGADVMTGWTGDDTFLVDNYLLNTTVGDVVTGGGGHDTLKASVSFNMAFNATDVDVLVLTGSAIIGYGNDLDNTITGTAGANTLHGGLGDDTVIGSGGTDKLFGDDGNDTLTGGAVIDTLDGGNGDDVLHGGGGNDTLVGGAGNDTLYGDAGNDLLEGGDGDDIYNITDLSDTFVEAANGGTDTIISTVSFSIAGLAEIENLTLAGGSSGTGNAKANVITGNGGNNLLSGLSGDDILTGNGGNDTLDGGIGNDTMTGGAGNDTFFVDSLGDTIFNGTGTDTVFSSIDYTLAATTISNLTLTGNVAVNATGNALDNILTGNSIANVLTGGAGNDTYVMDNTVDTIVEANGEGTDLVLSSVSFDLTSALYVGQEIENITLTGTANINATGNLLNNTLTGNSGIDTLAGGAGNDTYVINNAGDVVIENSGDAHDRIDVGFSYALLPSAVSDIEDLYLTGTANINGTGNDKANIITGNSGDNLLDAQASPLAAGDTYIGSAGNDTYMVDESTDVVLGATLTGTDGGTDLVITSVDYDMSANATITENLTLTGGAVTASGNAFDNVITGDSQNNTLFGLGGNDTFRAGSLGSVDSFVGGTGNDTYFIDNSADKIIEVNGEGTDVVFASVSYDMSVNAGEVEKLTLTGSAAVFAIGNGSDNIITGNNINNTLDGQAGDDTLDGGAGADSMIGGTGNDTFIVDNALDVVIEAADPGSQDLIVTSVANANLSTNPTYVLPSSAVSEVENLTLTGNANVNGTGNDLNNTITGNSGVNTLDGGLGADVLIGSGSDAYIIDNAGDSVIGSGTAYTSVSWDMGSNALNVGNLTVTGTGTVSVTGNGLDNVIVTNSGINAVDGGAGNDTIYVHNAADTVTDADSAIVHDVIMIDTASIGAASSYNMMTNAANVNVLTITGIGNFGVTGNDAGDTITGNSGINQFIGGSGDDTFYVDPNDFVVDGALSATDSDTIGAAFSINLNTDEALGGAAHWKGVEDILLTGTAALSAIGDTAVNTITGNGGNDILDDGGLLVGSGADTLIGGAGNDTYYVNNTSDVVDEQHHSGAGADIIISTVNYDMSASVSQSVEKLTLLGLAIWGFGNESANVIVGNALDNTLNGFGGTDTLNGGLGNDTYYVDANDVIIDSGGSADKVISSMHSYTLANNIEVLELSSALTAVSGTGNALNNLITGNTLDNTLDGGIGADTMMGGDGNDTYYVDNIGDVVLETLDTNNSATPPAGIHDLIISKLSWTLPDSSDPNSQIEDLTLTGSASRGIGNDLNNHITGDAAANTLVGSTGGDYLDGGAGNDVLWADNSPTLGGGFDNFSDDNTLDGGAGRDIIHCGTGRDTVVIDPDATLNVDTIYNFTSGQDTLFFESVLQGFDPLKNIIDDFVAYRYDAKTNNTYIYIDSDGATVNGAHFALAAIMVNIDYT